MLCAVDFSKNLEVLCEQNLINEKIQACTAMRRVKDRNDLIVGCYKHLLVVRYLAGEQRFTILKRVDGVHSNTFSDLVLFKNKVFSVCKKD